MHERRTGTTWLLLQAAALDAGAADRFLRAPEAGAVTLFVGTTRQWTDGRETARLYYEAFEPMALKEMGRLAEAALSRWPLQKVCLSHRLGEVPVAEASVVVGASAPHREDAFAAARFLIDALKEEVPIWKRETYADGQSAWVEGELPGAPDGAGKD